MDEGQKLYDQYAQEFEQAKASAFANADVNNLLTIDLLSQLIYAQNFSMPAGYVDDADDNSWLLKVGEEYSSVADLEGALLLHIEGVTDVYLSDVADVAVVGQRRRFLHPAERRAGRGPEYLQEHFGQRQRSVGCLPGRVRCHGAAV